MAEILATYRLQLHAGFPLPRARDLIPYLHRLGVTHVYSSPLLQARRGSTHGYDVVDPTRLNAELGTEQDLAALVAELQGYRMGLVLDIVPNHVAASSENPAWEDVLTHGPASAYARWFDIEWRAPERQLHQRLVIPVLAEVRSRVLDRGEITTVLDLGTPRIRYWEHTFPLDPATLPALLQPAVAESDRALGVAHPASLELATVLARLRGLPRRAARGARAARRRADASRALEDLRRLQAEQPEVLRAVERAVQAFGQGEGARARLARLLDAQAYRLVHWRRAARELNYRRFFDVNELVALHMEDPEVFAQTHALLLAWRARGWIDGFRVDHPDGLLDPLAYLLQLARAAFPDAITPPVFVEKILVPGERLRETWPVAGTTGYDFLNEAEAIFIDPGGVEQVERDYRRIIRQPLTFATIARLAKLRVLESAFWAGVRWLAARLDRLSGPDRPLPSVPIAELTRAVIDTIVALPVYRTYVDERSPVPQDEDRRLLESALADARRRGRAGEQALSLLRSVLLAEEGSIRSAEHERLRLRFVQRFQQLCGPAMAKGVEDTAFFVYVPLLSRNEVGGGPEPAATPATELLHAGNLHRAARWPLGMVAVTTHDTKRSADVRARLDVLSEIPADWEERLYHWRRLNRPLKELVRGRRVPDPNTVYHILQALVGIWPLEWARPGAMTFADGECLASLRQRLVAYGIKAAREAKLRTTWTDPDEEFEGGLRGYIEGMLDPARSGELLQDLARFVARIARFGLWNSLARTLVHLAAPGVPDIYQGDELWNFTLVDPDNRREVDFAARDRLLAEVEVCDRGTDQERRKLLRELMECPEDGRIKLHLIRAALHARRDRPELFRGADYHPLEPEGAAREHLFGFAREHRDGRVVVVVPRLLATLLGAADRPPTDSAAWANTRVRLPPGWPGVWRCALSGEEVRSTPDGFLDAAELFRWLPAALLLAPPLA